MSRHNFYFLPSFYKKQLSPFGQKVLDYMVETMKKDIKENKKNIRRKYDEQSKVLTFSAELRGHVDVAETSDVLNVPTSKELVNSAVVLETNETTKSFELIQPIYCDKSYEIPGINDNTIGINHKENGKNGTTDVGWDDMFDSELLPEINEIRNNHQYRETNNHQNYIQKQDGNFIEFPVKSSEDAHISEDIHIIKYAHIVNNEVKKNNTKITKNKSHSEITDVIPKKVKRVVSEAKNASFRKQSYTCTKTVKNWLTDIKFENAFEDEIKTHTLHEMDNTKSDNKYDNKEKITKKMFNENKNKKVIQTQLANKDGIMKFKKPKEIIIKEAKSKNEVTCGTDTTTEIVKENKIKAKFIVPIKSQLPVKDIIYEITTINEYNYETIKAELLNTEIIVVLVYSNGLCQLNSHHTDDTWVPEGFIINFNDTFCYLKQSDKMFREIMLHVLEYSHLVCYDGKNILTYLMTQLDTKIEKSTLKITDLKIGASLLESDNPPDNFTELQQLLSFTPEYTVANECILQKCVWYMTLLKKCADRLKALMVENSLWTVFIEIEMPLLPIIADMEHQGIHVDMEKLKSMGDVLLTKMKEIEQECYKAAGKTFQINSTVQVRSILYDELQLDSKCNVKIRETIQGAKSTSETMLRNLMSVHPLPRLILQYRHLHKAHATFVTGITQHVRDGVVRPTWVQTAAATGRIACNNPNLQAIPKVPFSLNMFSDQEIQGEETLNFRSVYTARPGHTLLAADFKHIECRVFAYAAADGALLEALRSGEDLFTVLAAKWLNKNESAVSGAERERTKRVVYASLYGAGGRRLADMLGLSYEQTLAVIATFNSTFPSLKSFGQQVSCKCAQAGGSVRSACGRRRRLPHIASGDWSLRAQAERQAVNFVVQGTAADVCKRAMVAVATAGACSSAALRLQIHDELVWELPDSRLGLAAAAIKEVMEYCGRDCGMDVKLPVAMSFGKNWGEMTDIENI